MKLLFLGDICTDTYSDKNMESFQHTKLYRYLTNYDGYIIGNLEAPILEKNIVDNQNKFSLLNKPGLFGMYDFCHAFTLANNHIFDQDIEGYKSTIEYLDHQNKLYFGSGVNLAESRKPLILNVDNKSIYVLAYNCYSTNSEFNAKTSSYGVSPLVFEYIEEDIKKAKQDKADYIFILPHWGIENEFYPTYEQVGFARRVIDLGADGIFGSHTHTIQSFENYEGKAIYYSLGNFLFNHFKIKENETYFQHKFNKEGLLVEITIGETIEAKEIYIKFDDHMVPELSDKNHISTKIDTVNDVLKEKTKNLKHKNMTPNLAMSLKYNGKNMQLVYDDNSLEKDMKIKYEKVKSQVKRVLIKKIKQLI